MSTTLNWYTYTDFTAGSFKVYRAITGLVIPFPNSLMAGDVLRFMATDSGQQTITIGTTDIDSVVIALNTARGMTAVKTADGTQILFRCNAGDKGKLILLPCTFLTDTSIQPGIITPALFFINIATVAAAEQVFEYSYEDLDGNIDDWYFITSLQGTLESLPSLPIHPVPNLEPACSVEGSILNASGYPVPGAKITARRNTATKDLCNTAVSGAEIHTTTDEYGRWSIQLLQRQTFLLSIPAIDYFAAIRTPEQTAILFKDLKPLPAESWDDFISGEMERHSRDNSCE